MVITDHMSTPVLKQSPNISTEQLKAPKLILGVEAGAGNGHLGVWHIEPTRWARRYMSFRKLIDDTAKRHLQALRIESSGLVADR